MTTRIETTILQNLIHNEEYARKVIPFLKKEYFNIQSEKIVLTEILKFFETYNKCPSADILNIEISNRTDVSQTDFSESIEIVDNLNNYNEVNNDWLIDQSEEFCKTRAVYNAMYEALYIAEGKDTKRSPDSIPSILSEALAVTFDNHVGHDYIEDALSRYEFYHKLEEKLPFNLEIFDKITSGGLPKKTLSVVMSGPGGGKSLFMCHEAANCLAQGKNVLYISMEMAEERIAERIDANLLNVNIKDLPHIDWSTYNNKIQKLKGKTEGKLIIKEYPTGGAHAGHFRALLQELKVKRNFVPQLIIIDYLNICMSQRVKNTSANSYSIVGSITEELRGLAIEFNVPVLTATQSGRGAIGASDAEMTDAADSIGIARTADFMFAIIRTEELDELGQVMIKQLKNRYNSPDYYKRFCLGIDFSKMKFYDVEQSAQEGLTGNKNEREDKDVPVFDSSTKSNSSKYSDFKF